MEGQGKIRGTNFAGANDKKIPHAKKSEVRK
jgi:hypothetical protein